MIELDVQFDTAGHVIAVGANTAEVRLTNSSMGPLVSSIGMKKYSKLMKTFYGVMFLRIKY